MDNEKTKPLSQEAVETAVNKAVNDVQGVPDNIKKQLTTEVTSISQEEEKTGQEMKMPTPEELVANSSMAIITNRKHLSKLLPKLGKKAMYRAVMAALDLPKEGEQVKLVTNDEKMAFRLMQSTVRAIYTVLFYHTSEQIIKKHNEEQTKKKEAAECQEPKSQSDGSESTKTKKQEKSESTSQQAQTETSKQ